MTRAMPVRLARIDELPDPGARGFDPEGCGRDSLFVVRRGETVRAYRDACPHYGDTAMAWRKDAYLNGDGTRIVCHAHGAQFDIESGMCLIGPCEGKRLVRLNIDVTQEGDIMLSATHKD
ncbi:Rieske 2Fe-2S domain-containing protein [Paraburkholderia sp. JHI869]|uniref:Rieske (2Fe-2S) protein n=1 Tax=Paraburkholderia sp. JHI869 TaxID=3112959 RepID=UPI0031784886